MQGEGLSDVALSVLGVLTSAETEGVSLSQITQITNADVFDIQEVLDNWFEFLQQQRIDKETRYSLYIILTFGIGWRSKLVTHNRPLA